MSPSEGGQADGLTGDGARAHQHHAEQTPVEARRSEPAGGAEAGATCVLLSQREQAVRVLKPSTDPAARNQIAGGSPAQPPGPPPCRPVEGFVMQIRGQRFLEAEREAGQHGLCDRFGPGMGGKRGGRARGREARPHDYPPEVVRRTGDKAIGFQPLATPAFGFRIGEVRATRPAHTKVGKHQSTRELPASAG